MSAADYPNVPGAKWTDTSFAAADAMLPHCARLQRAALAAIREAGSAGLTAEELAARLQVDRTTIQPRTSELRRKALIRDSGQRRLNASRKRAIVWTAEVRP